MNTDDNNQERKREHSRKGKKFVNYLKPSNNLHSSRGKQWHAVLCEVKHWLQLITKMTIRRDGSYQYPLVMSVAFSELGHELPKNIFQAKSYITKFNPFNISEKTHVSPQKQTIYYLLHNLLFI